MRKLKIKKIVSVVLSLIMIMSTLTVFATENQTTNGTIVLNSDDLFSKEVGIGYYDNVVINDDYVATYGTNSWVRYLAYAEKSGEYKITFDMSRPNWTADTWITVYNETQGMKTRAVYGKSNGVRKDDWVPIQYDGSPWQYSTSATTDDKESISIYLNKGYNILKITAQDTSMYNVILTPLFENPECYGFTMSGESLSSTKIQPKSSVTYDVYADESGSYQLSLKVYSDYAEQINLVTVNGKDYTGGAVDGDKKIEFITNWSERWSGGAKLPVVDLKKGKNTVTLTRTGGNNVPITIHGLRFVKNTKSETSSESVMKSEITKDNLATYISSNSVIVNNGNIVLDSQNSLNTYGIVTFKESFEKGTYNIAVTLGENVSEETKFKIKSLKTTEEYEFTIPSGTLANEKITKQTELEGGEDTYVIVPVSGNAKVSKITFNNIDNPPVLEDDDLPVVTLETLNDANSFTDEITKSDNAYVVKFGSDNEETVYSLSLECDLSEEKLNIYLDGIKIYENVTANEVRNLVFAKGNHELKIEYVNSDPNITKIILNKKDNESGSIIYVNGLDYTTPDGTVEPDETNNRVLLRPSASVKYTFDLPKEGRYLLHFHYGTTGADEWFNITNETTSENFRGIFSNSPYKETHTTQANKNNAGQAKMFFDCTAGENVFLIKKENNPGYIYKIGLEYVPNDVLINSAKVGGVELLGYNKITPSADTITLTFSDVINDSSLSSHINLKDTDGINYPFDISYEDETVTLKLKKSLQPNCEYTIIAKDIKCSSSEMIEEKEVTFKTRDEISDGTTTITCDSIETSLETVKAKGTLTAGNKNLISQRAVRMYLWVLGSGDREYLGDAYTDENGVYEVSGTIDKNAHESGKYGIYLVPQYDKSSYITKTIYYVNKTLTTDISQAFSEAETVEKVKNVFETYKNYLSVNVKNDVSIVGENFYNHFISYEFENMNAFYEYYNKMYMFEGMRNSNSVDTLSEFLYNKDNCEKIGFDYNKISVIKSNKTAFLTEVKEMTESNFNDYVEKFEKILEKYLYKESEKEDISLGLQNITVIKGKSFDVIFDAKKDLSSVKKFELDIDFGSENAVDKDNISLSSDFKGTNSITNENGKIKVVYTYKNLSDIKKLATLNLTANTVGNYNVTYSGKIYYDFNGYEIIKDISLETFDFVVHTATNVTPTVKPGSGYFGGSSGGSSYVPPKQNDATEDNNKENDNIYKFLDIKNHEWAEESINALLKKGVISQPNDKKYRPDDNITREEFVKLIITLLDLKSSSKNVNFNDLQKEHWAYEYIAIAVDNGIISGMNENNFGIGQNITREQMATIIARVLELYGKKDLFDKDEKFVDDSEISSYAKDSVMKVKYYKIINGIGDNVFAPKSNATRAQAAKIIYELSKVVGI